MIQERQFTKSLWEVNRIQADFFQRKEQATKALEILRPENMKVFMDKRMKKWYTIGEVKKKLKFLLQRLSIGKRKD